MKLALGTVQFGIPYGVANTRGRPDENVVAQILKRAAAAGVRVVDTARLYGESEAMLGRCLPVGHRFDIVTKTPKFAGMIERDAVLGLRLAFDDSCSDLRTSRIYGLLVHDAGDLLGPVGDALWQVMSELRSEGRVTKIGASVYSGTQVDALMRRYPIDLVQLPLSLLDQRLVRGGQLDALHSRGIEVHARSVFLQGALLMSPDALPHHLVSLRPCVDRVSKQAAVQGIDTLNAALRYVAGLPQVDAVVCGVDGVDQFEELVASLQSTSPSLSTAQAAACACNEAQLLDPSQWSFI